MFGDIARLQCKGKLTRQFAWRRREINTAGAIIVGLDHTPAADLVVLVVITRIFARFAIRVAAHGTLGVRHPTVLAARVCSSETGIEKGSNTYVAGVM